MEKITAPSELRRVAALLQTQSLSRGVFKKHSTVSTTTIEATFGSWNEAVKEAGLTPLPRGGISKAEAKRLDILWFDRQAQPTKQRISDEDALQALVDLTQELNKRPSSNQVNAKGKYSSEVYMNRWGSVAAACEAAYVRYENPLNVGR